jgi:YggT family protein
VIAFLIWLLNVYLVIVLLRIVLSWFPTSGGGFLESAQRVLIAATEPVLGPLRAVLPPVRLGAVALDLSPIVLIIGIQVLASVLRSFL